MNYQSLTKEELIRQLLELQQENNLLKATHNQEINILRKLSEAVEQSPVSIVITNLDGNIEYANAKTSDTTGYSLDELMGQNPRMFKSGETSSEEYRHLWDAISSANVWKGVFHNKRKNGELYWESARIAPIVDSDGNMISYLAIKEDITERKKTEKEIMLKNLELQKANAEKDTFFSIIAHDLRSPFSGFLGLTDILSDDSQDLSAEELKELSKHLNISAHSTFNLLEDLLEWAKMERGLIDFNPRVITIKKAVDESLFILGESARRKLIDIVIDIQNHQVFADSHMLQTVLRNLISNAIKFTNRGGRVSISSAPYENRRLLVSVKDTGIGMRADMLDNIFRIGAHTKRAGIEGEHSSGLGLLLCREFVEKQGGEIWVESEEGAGSAFYFTVPLHE